MPGEGERSCYFDRGAQRIDAVTFARLCAAPGYRHVAKTCLAGGVRVVTTWRGVDLRAGSSSRCWGAPLIFETVVYGGDRYLALSPSLAGARAAHEQAVAYVSAKQRRSQEVS